MLKSNLIFIQVLTKLTTNVTLTTSMLWKNYPIFNTSVWQQYEPQGLSTKAGRVKSTKLKVF